jgi:tight adherence protein B
MDLFILGAAIFFLTIIIVELLAYSYRNLRSTQRAKIRKRLRRYAYVEDGMEGSEILKKRIYSDIPWLNRLLHALPLCKHLTGLLFANAKYPMAFYLLLSAFLGFSGSMRAISLQEILSCPLVAVIGLFLPYVSLSRDRANRVAKFKKQLPEALDLIARALKAGHAFTGGMSMLSEEFGDPVGPEFAEALDEINYGVSVSDALKNMAGRIDCDELKYFIVGVILQRETGGNLAELGNPCEPDRSG